MRRKFFIIDVVAGIWDQLLSEMQFMNSCL